MDRITVGSESTVKDFSSKPLDLKEKLPQKKLVLLKKKLKTFLLFCHV